MLGICRLLEQSVVTMEVDVRTPTNHSQTVTGTERWRMYRTKLSSLSPSHKQTQRHSVINAAASVSVCVPSCGEVNGEGERYHARWLAIACLPVSVCKVEKGCWGCCVEVNECWWPVGQWPCQPTPSIIPSALRNERHERGSWENSCCQHLWRPLASL